MDPRREDRLERLFEEASALVPTAREHFVLVSCADDPELREILAGLLARSRAAHAFVAEVAAPAVDRGLTALFDADGRGDPLVGTVVAHFRILAPLGAGGMSRVYEARDEVLGRVVALKLLPADAWDDEALRRRFEREARAASAVDHPNVCAIHEFGRTAAGQPFIAMALCPGESLRDIVARGPLPVATALDYAAQMAEALRHAHDAGVVHRDIKPANVMVAADGRVRIVDFGIALVRGDSTREGVSLGTVAYMSPEQTRGAAVDARSDLWSVGAVLHEMLTGRKAFGRDGDAATVHAIRHDPPGLADGVAHSVPWQVAAIVSRCLEKEPARRYQGAAALLADLDAVRRGESPARRRRRAWPLAATAALLPLALHSAPVARAAPPHVVDPAAMALFIQGAQSRDVGEYMRLLDRAIATDPLFALAHAERGIRYTLTVRDSAGARREAALALALDPRLPRAWLARGLERSWMAHDWTQAERAFRRALELDPGAYDAHHELAMLLMRLGRCDEAIAEERQALLNQPTSGWVQGGLGEILHYCRRYDDAVREVERTFPLARDSSGTWNRLGETYFAMGRLAEARAAYARGGDPVPPWVDAALGDRPAALAKVAAGEARWARGEADYWTAWSLARAYTTLGDHAAALAWLERVEATGKGPIVYLAVEPHFAPLRAEPRFRAMLRRLRLG